MTQELVEAEMTIPAPIMKLNPYMVSDGCPEEGAALVFAHTARKARVIGFPTISGWCDDVEFINMRAVRLRGNHHYKDADQEKLKADIPHCIEDPTGCKICGMWGNPQDDLGRCTDCHEETEGETP